MTNIELPVSFVAKSALNYNYIIYKCSQMALPAKSLSAAFSGVRLVSARNSSSAPKVGPVKNCEVLTL